MEHFFVSASVYTFMVSFYFRRPFSGLGCYLAYLCVLIWHIPVGSLILSLLTIALISSLFGWFISTIVNYHLYINFSNMCCKSNAAVVVKLIVVFLWTLVYDAMYTVNYFLPIYFLGLLVVHAIFWFAVNHLDFHKVKCEGWSFLSTCASSRSVEGCELWESKFYLLVALLIMFVGSLLNYLTLLQVSWIKPLTVHLIILIAFLVYAFVLLVIRVYGNGHCYKKRKKKKYRDSEC